jgi:tetratricopeptide (TPR) repeat protein
MIKIKDKKKFGFFVVILICFLFSGVYLFKKVGDWKENRSNQKASSMENDPDYNESMNKISEGDFESASKILEESLKEDSNNSQKLKMLAISQYNEKKYDEAENNFKKLLEEDKESSFIYYNSLANIYRDKEKYDEAIEYYEKAVEANPEYETAYLNLAILYKIEKQDLDKYEEIIQRGLEKIPESEALKKM